jgi:DNA invertase Pin-like site-specific DNA recombinase
MEGRFISYYRVSTKRQGQSGLGLEAQKAQVLAYLNGGQWELLQEYTEIESGKSTTNRPVLRQALEHCRKAKATLVIAKLDRLARNVAFISGLIESKVRFVAADMPDADKTMLQIYAVMAERERDAISKRTKEALAVAKARGVRLGRGEEMHANADAFAKTMAPIVAQMQADGATSVRKLCEALNTQVIPTFRGEGTWHVPTVHRLLTRLATL